MYYILRVYIKLASLGYQYNCDIGNIITQDILKLVYFFRNNVLTDILNYPLVEQKSDY